MAEYYRQNSSAPSIPPSASLEEQRPKQSSSVRRGCICLDIWLQNVSEGIVNSCFWKITISFFTFVLLFGSPLQFWLVPATGDPVFNAIYMVGFVIFMIDIVFNSYADPEYMVCDPCNRRLRNPHPNHVQQQRIWTFGFGSYNFWCDLISSVGFLYDVSFINKSEFSMQVIDIELDLIGVPTNFDYAVNSPQPVEQNFNFIVLIFKAARVARLVPSTKVVELSEKVSLYWYVERFNPMFWWRKFWEHRERTNRMKEEMEKRKRSNLVRRASWGGLEIAALAAVKAKAEEEKKWKENGNLGYKILNLGKNSLRYLGILPNANAELNRHIAATKIQRAWRSRLAKPILEARSDDGMMASGEGSLAWLSRDSASSSTLKKRSIMSRNGPSNRTLLGRISEKPLFGSNRATKTKQLVKDETGDQVFTKKKSSRADHSQVGTAMAEVTGQRVGIFILLSLLFVLLFTYYEVDSTRPSLMVVLHGQTIRTSIQSIAQKAVDTARRGALPELYFYTSNSTYYGTFLSLTYNVSNYDVNSLRERDKLQIIVSNLYGMSEGFFVIRQEMVQSAQVELLATIFVLFIWFFGVSAFAGPIMTFVIIPIERMVRLLGMLMMDPLGYQSNLRFKNFLLEEDQIVKKSQWTRDVLKGMETSFLMSTILRIGSLMKVGFGSAGVEIIRNNLQKGQSKNMLILDSQGSTVSCIFLFCDIRQFTDATECLQEEVFVFTNRIAAVVHSICHSYGGSANKNVGDAFLVSWLLDDESTGATSRFSSRKSHTYSAKHHQADKALLSVVKICIALHHDNYYIETMSNHPRTALLNKLKNRPGPVVQMGFGLHAGKAVQGAIGSQRKIDATYVSEAVERAEFLESSTKKYKLQMLMSDNFNRLLHPSTRRRCRKVDQIMFHNEDDDEEEDYGPQGDTMELYTYDLDVDALWEDTKKGTDGDNSVSEGDDSGVMSSSRRGTGPSATRGSGNGLLKKTRRMSIRSFESKNPGTSDEMKSSNLVLPDSQGGSASTLVAATTRSASIGSDPGQSFAYPAETDLKEEQKLSLKTPELVLPTGPALYSANVWLQSDIRRIRSKFNMAFFSTYNSGLQKYYSKDWDGAKQYFEAIMERFEDGPSKYFLNEMKKHNHIPPPNFQPYGRA